ncbi:hypothetical protein K4L44_05045 [Halosquirtibacter laminarini]|uniref:Uncharacterized protein n=1 Tax=Halosquirtibacter laminarini TaxID=3374600 RepID=A0AC61NI35_9BACT|nr:hypothetical protein K4L44_05045 [Prolixibacteraceae bacterium]
MKRLHTLSTMIMIILCLTRVSAQDKNYQISGYIKNMEGLFFMDPASQQLMGMSSSVMDYNLTHQRFNFDYFVSSDLVFTMQMRTRLYAGSMVRYVPQFAELTAVDNGKVDMSWNLATGDSWFLNTNIDRLYLDYTYGEWNVTVGRQRINWGINFIWNPNDLFNTYNYLDFDYEERPGTDAVKLTRYFGYTSSFEVAYKMADNMIDRTLAASYRFNYKNYDIQLIGGWKGYDMVIGTGWTGDISGAGFRGEVSYFQPMTGYKDKSEEALVASLSLDYTFPKGLYLQSSFLYNSLGTTGDINQMSLQYVDTNLSAKNLSLGKYEGFMQASYQLSPIVYLSGSTIINLSDWSGYIGPSVTFSLMDDLELMAMGQVFWGKDLTEYGTQPNSVYLRLKYSF